jgi:hypothetical protein
MDSSAPDENRSVECALRQPSRLRQHHRQLRQRASQQHPCLCRTGRRALLPCLHQEERQQHAGGGSGQPRARQRRYAPQAQPLRVGDQDHSGRHRQEELRVDGAERDARSGRRQQDEGHRQRLLARACQALALDQHIDQQHLHRDLRAEQKMAGLLQRQRAGGNQAANIGEQRVIALVRRNQSAPQARVPRITQVHASFFVINKAVE